MNNKVLFVDDEESILKSSRRILRKEIDFYGATSGKNALMKMKIEGPFSVVVSDMQMPGMDGIEFLSEVKKYYPDTVRIMLTGNADLEVAMNAVNEGNIFRFLTKPVSPDNLKKAIKAGVEQFRLISAEKELLEKTLTNSIEVLTEVTAFVSPDIGNRSARIQRYVEHIITKLKADQIWQFRIAGLLSQIGLLSIPIELRRKIFSNAKLNEQEQEIFNSYPIVGRKLIGKIPRLRNVSIMIGGQLKNYDEYSVNARNNPVALGAQMLKVAIDFDNLTVNGMLREKVLKKMQEEGNKYNPYLLKLLEDVSVKAPDFKLSRLMISDLGFFMEFNENVRAKNGVVLIPKGKEVNRTVLDLLHSFANGIGVYEPIEMKVYQ